jgi:dihydrofolate reductase
MSAPAAPSPGRPARLSLIAAMAANRVIGAGNALPWRLPADLRRFKRLTMGACLVMGRRTWESIGRPLPGRTTVVVSRRPGYAAPGALVAHSLPAALDAARRAGEGETFVAGGAEVYRQTLALADRLYLTVIHRDFAGDALFPAFDPAGWRLIEAERHGPECHGAEGHAAEHHAVEGHQAERHRAEGHQAERQDGAAASAPPADALSYSFLVYERTGDAH